MRYDTYSPDSCGSDNRGECTALQALRIYARRQPLRLLAEQLEVLAMCEPLGSQTRLAVYGCAERITPQALRELGSKEVTELLRGPMATRWPSVGHMSIRSVPGMVKIRDLLADALDESVPIEQRMARLWPDGRQTLHTSLTVHTVTPFLHVAGPSRYAVWSAEVQQGLRMLGLWPQPAAIGGRAGRYLALSETARQIAGELRTDMWTLETLLRRVAHYDNVGKPSYDTEAW